MNQAVTARLTGAIPTLASLNFEETTQFYQKLGFEVLHSDISFLLLHRDGVRLSFWLTGNRRVPQATSCWLEVTGIATLYEHFNALNIVHRKGHLVANSLQRYGFTSEEIVRNSDGSFAVHIASRARAGNWLPTGGIERYTLMLRLYDTPVGVATRTQRDAPMPSIATAGCS